MDLDELIARITREMLPTLSEASRPGAGAHAGADGSAGGAKAQGLAANDPCRGAVGDCAGCGMCAGLNAAAVGQVVSAGAERISAHPGTPEIHQDLAGMIDHTLLKADATEAQVRKLCDEALRYGFASV